MFPVAERFHREVVIRRRGRDRNLRMRFPALNGRNDGHGSYARENHDRNMKFSTGHTLSAEV
jgi:hypothetical protein